MKPTESASSAQVLKKTQPEEYDLVIVGDGTGSTLAAWTFASDGKRVAVVERKFIGGAGPHNAGLPGKKNNHHAENAGRFSRAGTGGNAQTSFASCKSARRGR